MLGPVPFQRGARGAVQTLLREAVFVLFVWGVGTHSNQALPFWVPTLFLGGESTIDNEAFSSWQNTHTQKKSVCVSVQKLETRKIVVFPLVSL